jgi:hypothetical protein
MPFINVTTYSLGYITPKKQCFLDYTLEDDGTVHQIFITAEESLALAEMFRNHGPVSFNTDGSYFSSAFRNVGVAAAEGSFDRQMKVPGA